MTPTEQNLAIEKACFEQGYHCAPKAPDGSRGWLHDQLCQCNGAGWNVQNYCGDLPAIIR